MLDWFRWLMSNISTDGWIINWRLQRINFALDELWKWSKVWFVVYGNGICFSPFEWKFIRFFSLIFHSALWTLLATTNFKYFILFLLLYLNPFYSPCFVLIRSYSRVFSFCDLCVFSSFHVHFVSVPEKLFAITEFVLCIFFFFFYLVFIMNAICEKNWIRNDWKNDWRVEIKTFNSKRSNLQSNWQTDSFV